MRFSLVSRSCRGRLLVIEYYPKKKETPRPLIGLMENQRTRTKSLLFGLTELNVEGPR